jgi:predicted O-linked N-acetylglucosamine transferase (SPINDLY family)
LFDSKGFARDLEDIYARLVAGRLTG